MSAKNSFIIHLRLLHLTEYKLYFNNYATGQPKIDVWRGVKRTMKLKGGRTPGRHCA